MLFGEALKTQQNAKKGHCEVRKLGTASFARVLGPRDDSCRCAVMDSAGVLSYRGPQFRQQSVNVAFCTVGELPAQLADSIFKAAVFGHGGAKGSGHTYDAGNSSSVRYGTYCSQAGENGAKEVNEVIEVNTPYSVKEVSRLMGLSPRYVTCSSRKSRASSSTR